MDYSKYLTRLAVLGVALSLELVTFSLTLSQVNAQSLEISLTFPQGKNIGAPARTSGGGQRAIATCATGTIPLTAIAPTNNLITTVSEHPTLFWYVPSTDAEKAELALFNDKGQEIYWTSFVLSHTSGILKLKLPDRVTLESYKRYTWKLVIICDMDDPSGNRYLEGLIERQNPDILATNLVDLQNNLAELETNPEDAKRRLNQQAREYAAAGIWSETVTIMTKLYEKFPTDKDVERDWIELLDSVELNGISTASVVDCCTIESQP